MLTYQIKQAQELSAGEISRVLHAWEVSEWMNLSETAFRQRFAQSEFHLLTNPHAALLAVARINFDFCLRIDGHRYAFAELVGLVSLQPRRGYGSHLLGLLTGNLRERNVEALGFCEQPLRGFYQQCNVSVLYGQARYVHERDHDQWVASTDDDILDLTLSRESADLLNGLNGQRLAYLLS
ncbi:MAG TPA: hypothetical protein VF646_18375 [Cytophagales bacterium]|jgi:hypothetical protein